MKSKDIYYFLMIVCFILTIIGIACGNEQAKNFGLLGFISGGIHYLADKIDELEKLIKK